MDRRTFLVVLTPLVAGCFGGRRSQSADDPAATDTAEPTPTATPEPTATPTATATPDPAASAAAAGLVRGRQDRPPEPAYVHTGRGSAARPPGRGPNRERSPRPGDGATRPQSPLAPSAAIPSRAS